MKKILSTAFAALALSMAMVSTVEAKRTRRGRAQSEPTQRQAVKDVIADANAVKAAPMDEKQAKAMTLANDLMANPDLADLAELQFKRKKIGADLETAREKLRTTKTGWLFNTDEYKDQKAIVNDLNTQLRDVNRKIASISKDLPKETSYAVYYGVAAVIGAIGVISALEYIYGGQEKSYTGRMMSGARAKIGEAGTYIGEKGSQAVGKGRRMLGYAE